LSARPADNSGRAAPALKPRKTPAPLLTADARDMTH